MSQHTETASSFEHIPPQHFTVEVALVPPRLGAYWLKKDRRMAKRTRNLRMASELENMTSPPDWCAVMDELNRTTWTLSVDETVLFLCFAAAGCFDL